MSSNWKKVKAMNKTQLTSKEISEFGEQISGIIKGLSVQNRLIDHLTFNLIDETDSTFVLDTTRSALSDMYDFTDYAIEQLDNIAVLLLVNDNKEDLKSWGHEVKDASHPIDTPAI